MKKTTKAINVLLFLLFSNYNSVYSQWQLGGNNDFPGATGLISNSNFFGGTQTADVRLGSGY